MAAYLRLAVVAFSLLLGVGCGGGEGGRPTPVGSSRSPAEYFNQTHGDTMTPHGRVKPGSAVDVGGGKVRYETDDGKRWEVTSQPAAGGGLRYGDPKAVD